MPLRDPRAFLYHILQALDDISALIAPLTLDQYEQDRFTRLAVERALTIIGEAVSQLGRVAPDVACLIPDASRIVGFRNILVHGYASIDNEIVWGVLEHDLDPLRAKVKALLDQDPLP